MRSSFALSTVMACLAVVGGATPALADHGPAGATGHTDARSLDLGRQTLPAGDGWAAATTGTTGGSAAAPADVHVVGNRRELVAALGGDNATNSGNATPKIVFVRGVVDANADDSGRPLTCADYAAPGYSLPAYLAAFDPATWGRDAEPSGPLEDARVASVANQRRQVRLRVGSNTTIVGLGRGATIRGGNLFLDRVDNVIIRNLAFEDAADCFPQWDPTDGETGNWNSEYDNVSVVGSTHVWVDHSTFTDGDNPDSGQPLLFGRPLQVHDGQLDITNGSDLVTVSWSRFVEHGKTMLIGSTNNPAQDLDKLRVTVHHNVFDTVQERAPRVRFGQVHVYNNSYTVAADSGYVYSLGVGVQSHTYAENNVFALDTGITPDRLLFDWGGTAIHITGSLVHAGHRVAPVDVLAAYNAVHELDFSSDVGWTPTLVRHVDPAWTVPLSTALFAGSGRL